MSAAPAFDAPIPRLVPRGPVIDRPTVSVWMFRPVEHMDAIPLLVVVQSRRARCLRWLTRGRIAAVTLGDTIFVAGRYPDPVLLAHEVVHVWQFYRESSGSRARYLWQYAVLLSRHGYQAHPWEVEATALAPRIARQLMAEYAG